MQEIETKLNEIGCTISTWIASHYLILVYNWPKFLKSLGYDDELLLKTITRRGCSLMFSVSGGKVELYNENLALPRDGKERFLTRHGTGDLFKDEVLIAALSKYSAKEIAQKAIEKITEIWKEKDSEL